jgi:hypothetical protein
MLKNERGKKKTDDECDAFQYDKNTKWKMQESLKIKKDGMREGKKTHKCQNKG